MKRIITILTIFMFLAIIPVYGIKPSQVKIGIDTLITGGDSDEHGCKGSAGYTWCESKNKCLRIWEESCLGIEKQTQEQERTQTKVQNQEQLQTGLENALKNMENNQARTRLQNNIQKFEENYEKRLAHMEEVKITNIDEETGESTIRVREQVRLLGLFKIKVRREFRLNENNQIQEKRMWFEGFIKSIE